MAHRAAAVDGLIADLVDHARLLKHRLGQEILERRLVDQRPQLVIVGHPQSRIVPVEPVNHRLQREAGVEAGSAGIAVDVALRLGGGLADRAQFGW